MARTSQDPEKNLGARFLLWGLNKVLPAQRDNEAAAAYLQKHPEINWSVVRPSYLVDEEEATGIYDVKETLPRHLFGKEQISRANVAHFMVSLLEDETKWKQYQHKLPYMHEPSPEKV